MDNQQKVPKYDESTPIWSKICSLFRVSNNWQTLTSKYYLPDLSSNKRSLLNQKVLKWNQGRVKSITRFLWRWLEFFATPTSHKNWYHSSPNCGEFSRCRESATFLICKRIIKLNQKTARRGGYIKCITSVAIACKLPDMEASRPFQLAVVDKLQIHHQRDPVSRNIWRNFRCHLILNVTTTICCTNKLKAVSNQLQLLYFTYSKRPQLFRHGKFN